MRMGMKRGLPGTRVQAFRDGANVRHACPYGDAYMVTEQTPPRILVFLVTEQCLMVAITNGRVSNAEPVDQPVCWCSYAKPVG
jgi:hypothetical protein